MNKCRWSFENGQMKIMFRKNGIVKILAQNRMKSIVWRSKFDVSDFTNHGNGEYIYKLQEDFFQAKVASLMVDDQYKVRYE